MNNNIILFSENSGWSVLCLLILIVVERNSEKCANFLQYEENGQQIANSIEEEKILEYGMSQKHIFVILISVYKSHF